MINDFMVQPQPSENRRADTLMREFYLNPPQKLKQVLHERRHDHLLTECPSCGNPMIPNTLDHFVPKEDWPEFAIFPNNLVPQCGGCAPIKSRRYYCNDKRRALFLHPMYSDALASVRFKIEVNLQGGQPKFSIEISVVNGLNPVDKARVALHLGSLSVKKRMQMFCYRHYTHWKCKLVEDGLDIKMLFESLLGNQLHVAYARNWSTAFMQGVLRNPAVVADLQRMSSQAPGRPPETLVELSI
jgi:hypothetical protein